MLCRSGFVAILFAFILLMPGLAFADIAVSTVRMDEYAQKWAGRLGNTSLASGQAELKNQAIIIKGFGIGAADEGMFAALEALYPSLSGIARSDDKMSDTDLLKYKFIAILGGSSQNRIASKFEGMPGLKWENLSDNSDPMVLRKASLPDGREVIIISLLRTYENLGKQNITSSPLGGVVPEKYIPIAATASTISIMALWPHLLKVLKMFTGKYVAAKGKQGKKMVTNELAIDIKHTHINLYELFSIFAAACIFAIGVAWTFAAGKDYLINIVGINIVVMSIIFYAQSALRIIISHFQKVKTQFQFWAEGSFFTLLSAYLGNMCASPGYFLEEQIKRAGDKRSDVEIEKDSTRNAAFLRIAIISITMLFGILFFAMNFLFPSKLLQVFMFSCTLNAACDLLPIKPMAGTVIKKWNLIAYALMALACWGVYLAVNII